MKFKIALAAAAAATMLTSLTVPAAHAWGPAGAPQIGFDRGSKWSQKFGNQTVKWYLDTGQSVKFGNIYAWQG